MNKLIDPNHAQPKFGVYAQPIDEINWQDFYYCNHFDKPHSKLKKRLDFNQFQFISLVNQEFIMGLAIVDIKISSLAFWYLYELKTQQYTEQSSIQLIPNKTEIQPYPECGKARFSSRAINIEIDASNPHKRQVRLRSNKGLSLDACIHTPNEYQPLRVCTRAGYKGWVFTQKSPALNSTGSLSVAHKHYDLEALHSLASVDWSAGFMRRHTFWNWASLAAYLPDNRRLGLNLAAGVNETGYSENALWLDGKLIKLDMAQFEFDRFNPNANWQVRSSDGCLDLTFSPLGQRTEKRNFIFSASNFRQFFGTFAGVIHLPNEQIKIENLFGFCEDHYAKW